MYDIIIASSISSLVTFVNRAVKNGYSPIGGVLVYKDNFYQAIFKPVEPSLEKLYERFK